MVLGGLVLIFAMFVFSSVSMVIPNAYADDFSFSSECIGGFWTLTVYDDDGNPFPNITVRLSSSPEIKFITDENGMVKIPPEQNDGGVKVSKGGYNDRAIITEKCQIPSKSESDAHEIVQPKTAINTSVELPPPRPINSEEKEYVESMNILGKIIRIYDDKICVEEFCKYDDRLPVHLEGNVGLNTKNTIKLQIILCNKNYILYCLNYPGLENAVVGEIYAENNDGGNFYAEWTIRKTAWTGLYQIKGVVDGRVVGEVGDTMMDMVNGISNGRIVILNNVEKLDASNTTFVTKEDATITVLDIEYGKVGGTVNYEICAKRDLKNPSFKIISDADNKDIVNKMELKKGECHEGSVTIMAKAPATIIVPLATEKSASSEEMNALKAELAELREMLEKKEATPKVPDWVKNNVQWWANGQVDDQTFLNGIEFMVKEKIINISNLPEQTSDVTEEIPDWIRNNAIWWSEGQISEDDFINGIEFLIQNGIIKVN